MKEEEILEYNKRCAEFLGYINTTPTDKDFDIYHNEKGMIIGNKIHTMIEPMSAKFHSDWNWISEIVEAISNKFGGVPFFKEVYQKWLYEDKSSEDFLIFRLKKEELVQAINQFLIWYNENKNLI